MSFAKLSEASHSSSEKGEIRIHEFVSRQMNIIQDIRIRNLQKSLEISLCC